MLKQCQTEDVHDMCSTLLATGFQSGGVVVSNGSSEVEAHSSGTIANSSTAT